MEHSRTPQTNILQTLISEVWIEELWLPVPRLTCKTWAAAISPFVRCLCYSNFSRGYLPLQFPDHNDQSEQEDLDTPVSSDCSTSPSSHYFDRFMDHGYSVYLLCPFLSWQLGKAVMNLQAFDEGTFCGYTLRRSPPCPTYHWNVPQASVTGACLPSRATKPSA